ncbi:MAG: tape measure protein [Clostridiales Family XIII bacterium]|jgi:tape measure domain-containing protein|nr:tape measure protein [Clostridiales Family XIII bacterium]
MATGVVRAGIKLNDGVSPVLKQMVSSVRGVIKAFDKLDQGVAKGVDVKALRKADNELLKIQNHLNNMNGASAGGGGGLGGVTKGFGKLGGAVVVANQALQFLDATAGRAVRAVGSAIGAVLSMGNERAGAIEGAEATLNGLHHSAEEIAAIMENAKQSVLGTKFGLGNAAEIAASAVAANIQPGKDLERYLTLIGDAASIAKVDMSEMGAVFNKVAAGEKMTAQELNQLTDKGIPALSLLADSMGTSTGAVRDMVSAGKIGIVELQNAIELGMGGAAKSVTTFESAVENTKAALSRFSEGLMVPLRGIGKEVLINVIPAINKLAGITEPVFEGMADRIGTVVNFLADELLPYLERIGPIIEKAGNFAIDIFEQIAPYIVAVTDMVLDMIEQFQDLTSGLANNEEAFKQLEIALIAIAGGAMLAFLEVILAINTACYGVATAVWAVIGAIQRIAAAFIDAARIIMQYVVGNEEAAKKLSDAAAAMADNATGSFEEMRKSALATGDAGKLMADMMVGGIESIANAMNGIDGLRSTLHIDILRRGFGAGAQGSANSTGQAITKIHPGTNRITGADTLTSGSGAAKQTAKNTKQTADNTAKSKEDLKYLRDVATRKAVNRFTTASLHLTYTANNKVDGNMDIDGMNQDFFGRLVEGVNAIAEA